jgi:hypothetical protein
MSPGLLKSAGSIPESLHSARESCESSVWNVSKHEESRSALEGKFKSIRDESTESVPWPAKTGRSKDEEDMLV